MTTGKWKVTCQLLQQKRTIKIESPTGEVSEGKIINVQARTNEAGDVEIECEIGEQ